MFKTLGYFVCTKTICFCSELYSGSHIELPPISKLSQKVNFKYCDLPYYITVSQTLFRNPKRPAELGNPNTCAETKLCLNYILFRLKK